MPSVCRVYHFQWWEVQNPRGWFCIHNICCFFVWWEKNFYHIT